MKNNKWLYFSHLPFMLLLYFLTPATHPASIKTIVFIITVCVQSIFLFIGYRLNKNKTAEERYFGLTEKLYTTTLFAAMGIYIKGIWAIIPPSLMGHLICGSMLLVMFVFFLYFALKKVEEKPDERFYADLAKAACLTLELIVLFLMILSVITFLMPFALTAGMILIFASTMILVFNIAFWIFEKRGD